MKNNIFRLLQAAAIVGLSAVSVYTTAVGLTFLMPVTAAWIAALAIQVVLVGAAMQAKGAIAELSGRIVLHAAIYLVAVLFSTTGSFIAYDQVFSTERRQAADHARLRDETMSYVMHVKAESARLTAALGNQVERLTKKLEYERDQGVLSHEGAGFGRRSAAVATLLQQARALDARTQEAQRDLDVALGGVHQLAATAGVIEFRDAVAKAEEAQGRLAGNAAAFADLLASEHDLGEMAGDSSRQVKLSWPSGPNYATIDESRSSVVVVRAYRDLAAAVPGSVIAMAAAVLNDVLLMLVVFVEGSSSPRRNPGNESPSTLAMDWRKAVRRYAAFVCRHEPDRELSLWCNFGDKILWGAEPVRVLQGGMSRDERGVLDWLRRAGVVEHRRNGVFVADADANTLRAFLLDETNRLVIPHDVTRARRPRRAVRNG